MREKKRKTTEKKNYPGIFRIICYLKQTLNLQSQNLRAHHIYQKKYNNNNNNCKKKDEKC